jgi:hypothetical protein
MKTIGINIDGVLRDWLDKFDRHYRKVFIHNPGIVAMNEENFTYREFTKEEENEEQSRIERLEKELLTLPVDSFDLLNHYKFEPKKIEMFEALELDNKSQKVELNTEPIYMTPKEHLEYFINEQYPYQIFAEAPEFKGAVEAANKIQHIGEKNGLFKVVLFSTLKHKAVPPTYGFLGKYHCRVKNVMFLESEEEKWNHADVIIDVHPKVFQSCPSNKKSIKINHLFNQWDSANYSFDSLKEIADEDFLFNLFNHNKQIKQ